jgi:hypothetical protein
MLELFRSAAEARPFSRAGPKQVWMHIQSTPATPLHIAETGVVGVDTRSDHPWDCV